MNSTLKSAVYLLAGVIAAYGIIAVLISIPVAVAVTVERMFSLDPVEMYLLGMVNGLLIWGLEDTLGENE